MASNKCAALFRCRRNTDEECVGDAFEDMEEFMIRNGALLLEKQISYGHGKGSNSNPLRIFSFGEILKATNNFDSRLVFERKVAIKYRGTLEDGRVVAIESPLVQLPFYPFVVDFFLNQVAVHQIISHKNVIKLHGCCLETQLPTLVHKFLPNGKLSDHIHGRDGSSDSISIRIPPYNVPWRETLRIAADISYALSYMHMALPKPIVHMNLRPQSIYLDESFNAKLGSFGRSVSITPGEDFISREVVGRPGYIDPEHKCTRRITECDVYSFGIVLVELLTGKDPWTVWTQKDCTLGEYFTCFFKQDGSVSEIVHPRVLREAAAKEIQGFAEIAARCIENRGEDRPTMREVAIELKRIHLAAKNRQG